MTQRPLTPKQRAQLLQLLDIGALDRATAAGPFHPGMRGSNVMVLGKLRDFALADSRTVREGEQGPYGQFTAYSLTANGLETARGLTS